MSAVVHPDKLIRLIPAEGGQLADFLELAANVGASRRFIEANTKTTAGQHGVSGETIGSTPIPLPPRSEIAVLVSRAQAGMSLAGKLESELTRESDTHMLRQSILAAAFRGDLIA
ncbi:MAG TPA: hypothetical protein VIJ55_11670 [Acetobacteraceae bacterium]